MLIYNIITVSILIFLSTMVMHVLLWRIFRPSRHILALLKVFVAFPVIAGSGLYFTHYISADWRELALTLLLYLCIAACYILSYPAVQAWSPSLLMVYLISRSDNGMSLDELKRNIDQKKIVRDRIDDLEKDGFIKLTDGDKNIVLTARGNFLAAFFINYRKLIGLDEGRG